MLGLSAGGSYALACAYLIPERVSVAVVVSGMPSVSRPQERRALAMGSRVLYRLAGPVPWLVQPVMALLFRLMIRALRRPERPAMREDMGLPFPPDVLADPQLRPLVIADLTEAVIRPGTRGLVDELARYARPRGFRLDQITVPVHLWHGDSDVSAPTALARAAAAAIRMPCGVRSRRSHRAIRSSRGDPQTGPGGRRGSIAPGGRPVRRC